MRVGYIGLGNMGGPLARRLQQSHDLLVFDFDPAAAARCEAAGSRVASSAVEVARESDVVFLCLPTSEHVRDLVAGDGGLIHAMQPGSMVVDQTSGDPLITREIAAQLGDLLVAMVDAPVSGGAAGAEAGTIAIMVGASEPDFARISPVLGAISSNVFRAGDVGCGHVMKLVNNMISGTQRLLTLEGTALAAKNGVEPAVALEILLAGGAKNAYMERMMVPNVLQGNLVAHFTLALAHKDVRLACELGEATGVPLQLGTTAREMYEACIAELGGSSQVDTAALVIDHRAGTHVVPADHQA